MTTEYDVTITPHDGLASTYRRVRSVFRDGNWLEITLSQRTVYVNLTDVVSYSVRLVDADSPKQDVVQRLDERRRATTPVAVAADDFPEPSPGGAA